MKTVLITGARGFIGRHLTKELVLRGYRVLSLDREVLDDYDIERGAQFVVDLRDTGAVDAVFQANEIDVVIDLAAIADLGQAPAVYGANLEIVGNLVSCVKRYSVDKYIFFRLNLFIAWRGLHRVASRITRPSTHTESLRLIARNVFVAI